MEDQKELNQDVKEEEIPEAVEQVAGRTFLSKDQIINAQDIFDEEVFVPEWNGYVTITTMPAGERDEWESTMVTKKEDGTVEGNLANWRANLLSRTMINKKRRLLFPNPQDILALAKKSGKVIDRLYDIAAKLNGIGEKDVVAMTKN